MWSRKKGGRSTHVTDMPPHESEPTDPRSARSRERLLNAATTLLATGGIEAVTVDAVTRVSKVARTTLYRHFDSSAALLAATFERLVPRATPAPAGGTLRDRLIELLDRQAKLIQEAPLQLTTMAWLAFAPAKPAAKGRPFTGDRQALNSLRHRIIKEYRVPFDEILATPQGRAELGAFDHEFALIQLVGPIVFAHLTGAREIDHDDCVRLVDDFIAARTGVRRGG